MRILTCPKCNSEIAINDNEVDSFDIDCDCGYVLTFRESYKYLSPDA